MRLSLIILAAAIPFAADAAQKKAKPAVPAVPAAPSQNAKPARALIDSDLNGRELTFLSSAIELGKTFRYLASQVPRTANPDLRGFGEDLVQTLSAQSAVLNTVAEMRNIKIPTVQGETERHLAVKLEKVEGIKLEKMLLDSFREADRQAVATYELGVQLKDPTIRKLSEQTLPQIREHLIVVETMTGIAPKRAGAEHAVAKEPSPAPATTATTPQTAGETPARRPGFRANVLPPGESGPKPGR